MKFDPQDPFPLVEIDGTNYVEAKRHADQVDLWLGLRVAETEASLAPPSVETQTWQGLPPSSWQTPYAEIRMMLDRVHPPEGATVVDLGCGYGRMAHVLNRHHPGVRFIGYEVSKPRALEARRVVRTLGNDLLQILEQDLAVEDFTPIPADIYFIYDFGTAAAVEKILGDLRETARSRKITLIARGRLIRSAVHARHPWLAEINEPEHTAHFSIYRS